MAEREGDVADWRGGVMAGGLLAERLWVELGRRAEMLLSFHRIIQVESQPGCYEEFTDKKPDEPLAEFLGENFH